MSKIIEINNFIDCLLNTRQRLFDHTILIYIIYDARTIIGFVGFLANLLNIPTDGTPVSAQKSASQKELLFVRL
jgi:hypothetical protein